MAKREGFKLHKFTYHNEGVAEQIPVTDRAEDRDKQQMEPAQRMHLYQSNPLDNLHSVGAISQSATMSR